MLLERDERRPRGAPPGCGVRLERIGVAPRSRIDRQMALLQGVSIEPGRVEVAPPQYLDFCPWHRCPVLPKRAPASLMARVVPVRSHWVWAGPGQRSAGTIGDQHEGEGFGQGGCSLRVGSAARAASPNRRGAAARGRYFRHQSGPVRVRVRGIGVERCHLQGTMPPVSPGGGAATVQLSHRAAAAARGKPQANPILLEATDPAEAMRPVRKRSR